MAKDKRRKKKTEPLGDQVQFKCSVEEKELVIDRAERLGLSYADMFLGSIDVRKIRALRKRK